MPSTGTIPLQQVIPGQLIASALWNNEFGNINTLMTPSGIDTYSGTDAQMQIQTNPYPGSVTSHATASSGELERIRYQLAQILGTDFWYKPAAIALATIAAIVIPVGGSIAYASATPPNANWHLKDGTAISRAGFPVLFSLIGTTFGVGDGSTTFNLPNSKDRMPIGAGNLYALGATGGSVAGALSASVTDPGHTHTQNAHTHTMANHTHGSAAHTHTVSQLGWGEGSPDAISGTLVTEDGSENSIPGAGRAINGITSGSTTPGSTGGPSTNTSDATTPTNNSNTTGITVSGTAATLPPYLAEYWMIRVA